MPHRTQDSGPRHVASRHSRRAMLAAAAGVAGSTALRPVVSHAQAATPEAASDTIHGAALEAALEKLDALAQQRIAYGAVPGIAIAVVHDDHVVFSQGYGVRDVDTGAPVDTDTVFQLASLSKPISSTVVAAVVGALNNYVHEHVRKRHPLQLLRHPIVAAAEQGIPDHRLLGNYEVRRLCAAESRARRP